MARVYGLIGYPLSHSFSKKYFTEKFAREGLAGHDYQLFEIRAIRELQNILDANPQLLGLNVTIPYKEAVIPYLHRLDPSAEKVGAVNVIKIRDKKLTGYNSDYYGFEQSLLAWLPEDHRHLKAIVLGTGGAAKAVTAVLTAHDIPYTLVSRRKAGQTITYAGLKSSDLMAESRLIINTTPLGMAPHTGQCPDIPYTRLGPGHFVYDLIYNPEQTELLHRAAARGATTKNGLEMLHLQAEKSWEIWTGQD